MKFSDIGFAFDLDGTLVDTEKLKAISHQKTISFYGGVSTLELYYEFIGNSFEFVFKQLSKLTSLNVSLEKYHQTFNEFYLAQLDGKLEANPGVKELLSGLVAKGIKTALVTSSERWMMEKIVNQIGIAIFFDVLISGDDVVANKPAPDPYVLAIARLNSKKTFAFEDTTPGILSAIEAGAIVFGVKNDYNTDKDLSLTKKVIYSFDRFNINEILKIY